MRSLTWNVNNYLTKKKAIEVNIVERIALISANWRI